MVGDVNLVKLLASETVTRRINRIELLEDDIVYLGREGCDMENPLWLALLDGGSLGRGGFWAN